MTRTRDWFNQYLLETGLLGNLTAITCGFLLLFKGHRFYLVVLMLSTGTLIGLASLA